HERDVVGVIEADDDVPLAVFLHPVEIRLRETLALVRREPEDRPVLTDALGELLRKLREPLGDRPEALALLRWKRDAAVLERLDEVLLQLLLRGGFRSDASHALEKLDVLKQLG